MGRALVCVMALAVALGCNEPERSSPPRQRDDVRLSGREFRPPTGKVRAVPPHNIHARGVGPYRLDARLQDVLGLLPHGPRVELMQIEGLVDYRLVRAERDALVIGVGRNGIVSFVSVLDPDIARTESGVGVGASPQDLAVALGAVAPTPDGGRDPRLIRFGSLPGTRFVVADGEVAAAVVTPPVEDSASDETACDSNELSTHADDITAAARLAGPVELAYGCFGGDGAAALAAGAGRVVVVGGKPGAWRRLASRTVAGLVFAAPVDVDDDGRHEIAVITEERGPDALRIGVELYRLDGARLSQLLSRRVHALSAAAARWVGADLRDIELLVEVRGRSGELEVGGLYLHRVDGELQNAVPLEPVVVAVRGDESAAPEPGEGAEGRGEGEAESEADSDAGAGATADELGDGDGKEPGRSRERPTAPEDASDSKAQPKPSDADGDAADADGDAAKEPPAAAPGRGI